MAGISRFVASFSNCRLFWRKSFEVGLGFPTYEWRTVCSGYCHLRIAIKQMNNENQDKSCKSRFYVSKTVGISGFFCALLLQTFRRIFFRSKPISLSRFAVDSVWRESTLVLVLISSGLSPRIYCPVILGFSSHEFSQIAIILRCLFIVAKAAL